MKKHKLAPDKIGRKYSKWMHLALASLIGASLAMSLEVPPSAAAPVVKPGKPLVKVRGKPTTKAAKKAALGAAATSLLLDPVVNLAAGPTDQSKIPHYFGPYPNWALSPLRTADAKVSIADCTGCPGTGATATATVDPQTEAVTAIAIVNPGSGYTRSHYHYSGVRDGCGCHPDGKLDQCRDQYLGHSDRPRLQAADCLDHGRRRRDGRDGHRLGRRGCGYPRQPR